MSGFLSPRLHLVTSTTTCRRFALPSLRLLVHSAWPSSSSRSFGNNKWNKEERRAPVLPDSIVTAGFVAEAVEARRVKVIDASWYLPVEQRDPRQEWTKKRIPRAVFFDIDRCSDKASPLPHMLPSPSQFAAEMSRHGIQMDDSIVVYDSKGIFSAPRMWFTLLCFGARDVAVLDGGLPYYEASLLPLETRPPSPIRATASSFAQQNLTEIFTVTYRQIWDNIKNPKFQLIDARSRGRFLGVDPEPRPGLKSGHIPHSISLPYTQLLKQKDGLALFKSPNELRSEFQNAGVDLSDPNARIVTSCGTGVTACVLALGLHQIGHRNISVYDGSWTEYAQQTESLIEQGE